MLSEVITGGELVLDLIVSLFSLSQDRYPKERKVKVRKIIILIKCFLSIGNHFLKWIWNIPFFTFTILSG